MAKMLWCVYVFFSIRAFLVSGERPSVYSLEASSSAHFKKTAGQTAAEFNVSGSNCWALQSCCCSLRENGDDSPKSWHCGCSLSCRRGLKMDPQKFCLQLPDKVGSDQSSQHPCIKLEGTEDTYKDRCFRLECPQAQHAAHALHADNQTKWSSCRLAKPEYEVAVGFTVSIPFFRVPLVALSVKIKADGVMTYHKPVEDHGYKSIHVSAGIEVSVSLASIGKVSFEFSGSFTIAGHCDKFSTLWNSLTALLVHDYFKFVKKSDKETAEAMQTLTDGLMDSEDLVEIGANGDMRADTLAITVEYAGKFRAGLAASLKLARWIDIDSTVESARESHRKTMVIIAPLGAPKDDDLHFPPAFKLLIKDDGYEWASISRVYGKTALGTIAATVQCGDSENDFGFEVALQSTAPTTKAGKAAALSVNKTPALVSDWTAFVNQVLQDPDLEDGYCKSGRVWGHKHMHERTAIVTQIFSHMLAVRQITDTEVVKVHVPKTKKGSPARAAVVLMRETDIPLLPPKLEALLGKGVSLLGNEIRMNSKKVEDLGATNIEDLAVNSTEPAQEPKLEHAVQPHHSSSAGAMPLN